MRLIKHYFDCSIGREIVLIGYSASVRIGICKLPYSCVLCKKKGSPLFQRQSLTKGQMKRDGIDLLWENKRLSFAGQWKGGGDTGRQTLFAAREGKICWHCTHNGAEVKIRWNGEEYSGKGYAEYVDITYPLWKLPFRTLKWGRWISGEGPEGVVWIGWEGESEMHAFWKTAGHRKETGCEEGGKEMQKKCVERYKVDEITYAEEGIRLGSEEIRMVSKEALRKEIVSKSVLKKKNFLSFFLPKSMRNMEESKYYGEGTMSGRPGTMIFEEVNWK